MVQACTNTLKPKKFKSQNGTTGAKGLSMTKHWKGCIASLKIQITNEAKHKHNEN